MKSERVIEAEAAARQEADNSAWARMNDVQRTQWFLRSTRLQDTDQFRNDFGSFNGPDPDMAYTNPTTKGSKTK